MCVCTKPDTSHNNIKRNQDRYRCKIWWRGRSRNTHRVRVRSTVDYTGQRALRTSPMGQSDVVVFLLVCRFYCFVFFFFVSLVSISYALLVLFFIVLLVVLFPFAYAV